MPNLRERFAILDRDKFTCQYCGRSAPKVELEIDHIIPKSLSGEDSISNYITSCHDCNRGKFNFIPLQLPLNITNVDIKHSFLKYRAGTSVKSHGSTFTLAEYKHWSRLFGTFRSAFELKKIISHPESWDNYYTKANQASNT